MQYTHREAIYFRMIERRFSIPRNANLLEIGFGNGGLLGYMRQTGRQVSGIETNPTLINRAIRAGVKCFDQLADIPEDCFDIVILMDVLEHIDQAAIPEFFKELERITKQGGRVIIRSPNGHSPLGLSNQHGDVTHVTVITIPKVDFWLRGLKLGIIYSGWDLPELSLSSPFRSIRNFAMLLLCWRDSQRKLFESCFGLSRQVY